MENSAVGVLKTLLYSDIFDYPLTKEEVYKYAIDASFSKKEIYSALHSLQKYIEVKDGYFFLKGRKEIVNKRKERIKAGNLKLKKANILIKKITFIPFIKFIGISGALSMNNADLDDDIDFFVITKKNLVWTTRFLLIIALKMLGVYRGKKDKLYKDKVCLNMIVAEDKLYFNKNLYTAHEIAQLIPVFDKDRTYEKLINLNPWTNIFLPNSKGNKKILIKTKENKKSLLLGFLFNFLKLEKMFCFLQFSYMKGSIGKEVIRDGYLGFHPFDYKGFVLNKYIKKLKEYNLQKLRI